MEQPWGKCILVLLLAMMISPSQQYEFEMAYQTKCLMEELSNNVLVVLDYKAFHKEQPEQPVPVTVTVCSGTSTAFTTDRHLPAGGSEW